MFKWRRIQVEYSVGCVCVPTPLLSQNIPKIDADPVSLRRWGSTGNWINGIIFGLLIFSNVHKVTPAVGLQLTGTDVTQRTVHEFILACLNINDDSSTPNTHWK